MEKTIRLFSSSSAREGLLPAVLHPFAFLIFLLFFFPELKDPLSSVCPRKISERLKISPRCLAVPAPCVKMSTRNMKWRGKTLSQNWSKPPLYHLHFSWQ